MPSLRHLLFMTLVSCAAITSHAQDPRPLADEKTRAQVSAFYETWTAAFESRDLDKLMSLYHPDTRYNAQAEPDKKLEDLRVTWAKEMKKPFDGMSWRFRIEHVYADGALVVVVAIWDARLKTPKGSVVAHTIRSVDVLTRSPGGLRVLHTVNYPEL